MKKVTFINGGYVGTSTNETIDFSERSWQYPFYATKGEKRFVLYFNCIYELIESYGEKNLMKESSEMPTEICPMPAGKVEEIGDALYFTNRLNFFELIPVEIYL